MKNTKIKSPIKLKKDCKSYSTKQSNATRITRKILAWYEQHGRKTLPWQRPRSAYRVWISEIMLQQTQVKTVIPYFKRFMKTFPNVQKLADAPIDTVLQHWSGLGYYARARHLHRAAQMIVNEYGGEFPNVRILLEQLPGVGRSTAAAIAAIAFDQPEAILDGNVKRVLTRLHAISEWPGQSQVQEQLWELAEYYTPKKQVAAYTQAIMDLGATLCTPSHPNCSVCPIQTHCLAFASGKPTQFPVKKPRNALPVKQRYFLMITNNRNEVLLIQRPPNGIWGGLWCFPECDLEAEVMVWCRNKLGYRVQHQANWDAFRHTFTHFHLDIYPVRLYATRRSKILKDVETQRWVSFEAATTAGLAKPTYKLLQQLQELTECERSIA